MDPCPHDTAAVIISHAFGCKESMVDPGHSPMDLRVKMVVPVLPQVILASPIVADEKQHVAITQGEKIGAHVILVILCPLPIRLIKRMKILPTNQVIRHKKVGRVTLVLFQALFATKDPANRWNYDEANYTVFPDGTILGLYWTWRSRDGDTMEIPWRRLRSIAVLRETTGEAWSHCPRNTRIDTSRQGKHGPLGTMKP